jgi:hypothetical protein
MKFQVLFLLALFFCGTFKTIGQEPDWFLKLKQIKVFQSTRQDVERIFENPEAVYSSNRDGKEAGWGEIIKYERPDGELQVFYSTGKCSEITNPVGWDLDNDVVVNIEFEPTKPVKLSKFNLDLTTFKRSKEFDTENWDYISEQLGINFNVLENKITSFKYSLTPEMREIDCEKLLIKQN